jgi:glycopeptide antibiotics resistance protein
MDVQFNNISVDISPLAWLTLVVFLIFQWRRKQRKSTIFCLLIFGIYLFYALQVTFFPMQINGGYADARRAVSTWTTDINLIPFYIPPGYFLRQGLVQFALIQFVENILLTIPFGFGINFILRLRRKDFL